MLALRHALRRLAAAPGFTITAIVALALGIGANGAVFSAVHGLLVRSLPFPDADRIVRITSVRGETDGPLSVPEQDDLRALPGIFESVALYTDQGMYNASGFGDPEELPATITTHDLTTVLGIAPRLGTMFPAEFDRSRAFGLVISHSLWQRRFAGTPDIVGRTMTLDGAEGYTIYGVLPPGISFPSDADLFRSAGISPAGAPAYTRRDVRQRMGLGRLQPGVTMEQARQATNPWMTVVGVAADIRHVSPRSVEYNVYRPYRQYWAGGSWFVARVARGDAAALLPQATQLVGGLDPNQSFFDAMSFDARVKRLMWREQLASQLVGAFGLVAALLAVVGLAGLVGYTVRQRRREIGVRLALGASDRQVMRTLLSDVVMLVVIGMASGAGIIAGVHRLFGHLLFEPSWGDYVLTLGVPLLLAIVATGVAGVTAWRGARIPLTDVLRG